MRLISAMVRLQRGIEGGQGVAVDWRTRDEVFTAKYERTTVRWAGTRRWRWKHAY